MLTANQTLDREFLEIRCHLLDIASAMDRIERGQSSEAIGEDFRLRKIGEALRVMAEGRADRAERVQMIFSLPYDENWQTTNT